MTHEQMGDTPERNENDDRFKEITGRLATYVAFEDGELVQKVVDKDQGSIELPDTPFEAPEEVQRDGKTYVRRDLDAEGLTSEEEKLAQQVALRDERVVTRADAILAGESVTNLPKTIQTEAGVTKVEKEIIRETVDSLVRAAEGKTAKDL